VTVVIVGLIMYFMHFNSPFSNYTLYGCAQVILLFICICSLIVLFTLGLFVYIIFNRLALLIFSLL